MSGRKRAAGIHGDAVAKIARKIIRGRMAAGAALPTEPEIGAELGVSRTVVREAIKTLAAKGMVVTGPRRGTRVRPFADWNQFDPDVVGFRVAAGVDARFLDDLLELRLTIEPMAARLAAQRATPADIARIEAALTLMADAVDDKGHYVAADLEFHQSILAASGNQFVASLAPLLGALLNVSFHHSVRSSEGAHEAVGLHRAVLRAIAGRKPAAAEKALRFLIQDARSDIKTALKHAESQAAADD
ncbi:MAG: FadR family transcriptional regulator [Proteobacteria bacterium]|nr:FadR family transcriptional regulator [Pseudomonadota bacterium]